MSKFEGFEEVRQDLQRSWRRSLVNIAVVPERIETVGRHAYVTGCDIENGRVIRATLSDRRQFDARKGLEQVFSECGPDGTIVLTDCAQNRNGTFEAGNSIAFPSGALVLADGVARISTPRCRPNGTWAQSIQHLRSGRARTCDRYTDVVDGILAALAEEGPGRSSAVVRGWHTDRGGAIAFEIAPVFDAAEMVYLNADESFDAFLASPSIFVAGLGTSASGHDCMGIVARMMDDPKTVVWEVIPKRTYSLSNLAAEAAALGTGRDLSAPYRLPSARDPLATGCLPTLLGFVERQGVLWPRIALPLRSGLPVPELRIATGRIKPDQAVRRPESSSKVSVERRNPAGHRMSKGLNLDAPPPTPPDLPQLADMGPDAPDLDGYAEDLEAVTRIRDASSVAPRTR